MGFPECIDSLKQTVKIHRHRRWRGLMYLASSVGHLHILFSVKMNSLQCLYPSLSHLPPPPHPPAKENRNLCLTSTSPPLHQTNKQKWKPFDMWKVRVAYGFYAVEKLKWTWCEMIWVFTLCGSYTSPAPSDFHFFLCTTLQLLDASRTGILMRMHTRVCYLQVLRVVVVGGGGVSLTVLLSGYAPHSPVLVSPEFTMIWWLASLFCLLCINKRCPSGSSVVVFSQKLLAYYGHWLWGGMSFSSSFLTDRGTADRMMSVGFNSCGWCLKRRNTV